MVVANWKKAVWVKGDELIFNWPVTTKSAEPMVPRFCAVAKLIPAILIMGVEVWAIVQTAVLIFVGVPVKVSVMVEVNVGVTVAVAGGAAKRNLYPLVPLRAAIST